MITVLNRKEVFSGYDLKKMSEARELLELNQIKYDYKVINRNSPSAFNDTRARCGTYGENPDRMREYIIYVHKKDYDLASAVLQGRAGN